MIRSQLEGVAITACDKCIAPSLFFGRYGRCEKVIGLVPGPLSILEAAGRHELREDIELFH